MLAHLEGHGHVKPAAEVPHASKIGGNEMRPIDLQILRRNPWTVDSDGINTTIKDGFYPQSRAASHIGDGSDRCDSEDGW